MTEKTENIKNNIRIVSLFSGSKGNCTYCAFGDYEFLIDAGGSSKKICDALSAIGSSPSRISDIFITHEHSDHVSALPVFLKRTNATVHMSALSATLLLKKEGRLAGRICEHPLLFEHRHENVSIRSFPLSHDSISCVGYLVSLGDENVFAAATDTGFMPIDAKELLCGCRYVMCEANHDIDMLIYGIYPQYLKERILSSRGHLSNKDSAAVVRYLFEHGCEKILLAHLSEENNTHAAALKEVLSECGSCFADRIFVASQGCSTVLV